MALVKTVLATQIKEILIEQSQLTDNQPDAIDKFADKLATAIDAYIKTGTVNVVTVGSATTQTGTGTIN